MVRVPARRTSQIVLGGGNNGLRSSRQDRRAPHGLGGCARVACLCGEAGRFPISRIVSPQ
jgi:hypothetical protein